MTIRTMIDARALNAELDRLERCAADAPADSYQEAKAIAELVSAFGAELIRGVRALGLRADTCDRIREVEAVVYGYIKGSNPDATVFPVAEGFGAAMEGPARDRVLEQTVRDMAFLRGVGVVQ